MDRKRRLYVELLEDRLPLAGVISQVGSFDTWDGGTIRSSDVAGITYHPSGHLYLVDSEINELAVFNGDNIFETSLTGDLVYREITSGNTEPTGITFNEFDGYFYVTNDTGSRFVTRYDGNLDDPRYEFSPQNDVSSATDPEGITSDPSTGYLYVADGKDGGLQVLTYSLDLSDSDEATRDVNFEGVFSVASQMVSLEGIAFHKPSGHLFLIDGTQELIFEYTTTGRLLEQYDISGFSPAPRSPQGLTFAPTSSTSDHPGAISLYLVDAGHNDSPDGRVYEATMEIPDAEASPVTIRVLGDVPYNLAQYSPLEADLANVGPNDEFFVHLGDIKSQGACEAPTYQNVASSLQTSSIPVFIIPGDNEWNDCSNPAQAWTHWESYLMRLEDNWSHSFAVMRQSIREENFAFVHGGVLFIGINLVGGTVHDASEWSQRMTDNADWVNENFNNFGSQVSSALVFAHAFPDPTGGDRQQFGQDFVTAAQNFGKPILYMMGNDHHWALNYPFSGAPNVMRVTVEQGVPSVRVTISNDPTSPFSFSSPEVPQPTNESPVLAAIGKKSVDDGSLLAFTAWATDPDSPANNLSFSLDSNAPAGASIDSMTGEFRWTPTETQGPATYSVTVRVSDDGVPSQEDFETITIMVNDGNLPPVLAAIGDQSVDEGSLLTFTATATDADLPANNFSFSLDAGAPPSAIIHPSTGQFSWTPPGGTALGNHTVTVRVSDDGVPSLADFETITITVNDVNLPPVLAAIDNMSVEEGSLLTFSASATDVDLPSDNLSFSLDAGAPAGATIKPSTGKFRWTPDEAAGPGVYSVTVRVTDDGTPALDDFETFEITVGEEFQAPVLAAIGNQTVDEDSLLTFTASATDADLPANSLSFSIDSGAPDGATIDSTTGEFRWTPGESSGPVVYSVTVRVTDDGSPTLDDFETITITVGEVNQAPVLAVIGNQSIDEGSLLTFMASATDPDLPANNLSYGLDPGAPAGATIDSTTGEFRWTPGEAAGPAVHTVTVRVTEDGTPSLSVFETFDISVGEVNQAPVLAAIGNQSIDEGSLLTFTASATDPDLPASDLSFSLDSGAPVGATIDSTTGEFRWTPGEGAGPAVYAVTVRVTDEGTPTLDDLETFNITVGEVNQAPVLAAIGDQSIEEGNLLTFMASANDPDLPANDLTFSLDAGAPAAATIDSITGEFRWTPGEADGPAVYSVTVRVTDDGTPGLDDFETIDITVGDVNQAPELAPIGDMSIEEGSSITFAASATDADLPANNLSFSLDAGAPAGATVDSTTGEFQWTPDEGVGPGVFTMTVRVTDDGIPSRDDFETIEITVNELRHPLDVNRDGKVSPLDALAIINKIDRLLPNEESGPANVDGYDYDTNDDGRISALDALLVINHISITSQEAESTVDNVIPRFEEVAPATESSLDDDLIRLLADDNIVAGLCKAFTKP